MKEKILVFLKGKLQGISENYLNGIAEHYSKTITEETQIETTFADGVIDLIKLNAGELQKEGDRRATDAVKTAVKNYQDKHGLDENGKPKVKPLEFLPPENDEPKLFTEWRAKQEQEITALKQKIEGFDKEKVREVLTNKVLGHEKLKDIPKSFLKGRNLVIESEDEIEKLVSAIELDYNGFKQEMVEKGIEISIPKSPDSEVKEGEAFGKNEAEKRNTAAPDGVVGKPI